MSMEISSIPPFAKDNINVLVETPKFSRFKYAYDPDFKVLVCEKELPEGSFIPYDFGFVPGTKAEDGDPIDVLILSNEPLIAGCIVECRLLGAITAKQKEKSKSFRNDRLIAIPSQMTTFAHLQSIDDLPDNILEQIESFFVTYNEQAGKKFTPLKRVGRSKAVKLIKECAIKNQLREK
jgi:inorganic pyrophosphatase